MFDVGCLSIPNPEPRDNMRASKVTKLLDTRRRLRDEGLKISDEEPWSATETVGTWVKGDAFKPGALASASAVKRRASDDGSCAMISGGAVIA
jgi:hypothetical protein